MIGGTIPLSRYPDTYNKQPICYVALSSLEELLMTKARQAQMAKQGKVAAKRVDTKRRR